ncbi:MAG TPA: acetyl-coenzyme A synthetase, partial [Cryomorphaceae bacterium]|nr:acetyl-coenzyme A synthetase [Cryomorphaceae bacterium]
MSYPYQVKSAQDYERAYKQALENPEGFWEEVAQNFQWKKPWHTALSWDFEGPNVRWFDGATLNITENCLDRHARSTPDRVALQWEPNDPSESGVSWTYAELLERVEAYCHVLTNRGIQKGDRVCLYMGMIPELAVAVLACARIG